MKTLVTGGTGFIGSHLVKALVEKRRDVRCLVRETSNAKFLEELGVELVYGDIMDKDSLKDAVKGVNIIYHLAGEVYSKRSNDYFKVNVKGTENLLEACLSEKIQKFIYFSSIAAIGPSPDRYISLNEGTPHNSINPYGRSKYEAEKLVMAFSEKHRIKVLVIRLPIVYGPGVNPSSRVSMLVQMIEKGLFKIIGSGDNLISLCYIDNLIEGVLLAEKKENSKSKIYHIADERPYTLNEVAKSIALEVGTNLGRFHMPIFIANIGAIVFTFLGKIFPSIPPFTLNTIKEVTSNWISDISLAKEELGFRPKIELKEGVKKTVSWFKNKSASF